MLMVSKNDVHELETMLINKHIDIVLINETHFTMYTSVHIPGYKLIRTNHHYNTAHGGVDIFIKSIIIFKPLHLFCQNYIYNPVPFYSI